jgi:Raf kinase inhibitor-like YbhB/YbcL family protein
MHRIPRRLVIIAVVVAVVVGTGAAAFAASGRLNFAFKSIREGVPNRIAGFSLTSIDIRQGQPIPRQFWGCTGPSVSPELSWSGAPAATQSYALTVYDPDAPTGSGFWHWIAWDIPPGTTSLPTGATLPAGAVNGPNDGGGFGYTGPCPPVGDIMHHYRFSILALDVASLQLPADTRAAFAGFTMRLHIIGAAALTATARQ